MTLIVRKPVGTKDQEFSSMAKGTEIPSFFHLNASQRRKKNTISGIWDENGIWCDTSESIAATAIAYFEALFTTSNPCRILEVTNTIPTKVTDEMNQGLIAAFTREEVVTTLKQMHPTKAPGLDGMSAIFFQKYWDVVGTDITCMVLNVLNSDMSIADINRTNITLIPKTNCPLKMSDFRPISLCNITYKLVSKVIANRLKNILPQIISENQSVFLSERLITDNVLVAYELMHYLEQKKEGKENFMAVKLDMSKAYDHVEWKFIEDVMEKMGFHEKWIQLIMKCISTVSYSVIILRSPISLSIFIMCRWFFFSDQ